MTIEPRTASEDKYCLRCAAIGLAGVGPTIFDGDKYFEMRKDGRVANCCEDCFERLKEECLED